MSVSVSNGMDGTKNLFYSICHVLPCFFSIHGLFQCGNATKDREEGIDALFIAGRSVFCNAAGKAKDIVLIFIAMTAGLTCAAGYVVIALMFTALVCAIMLVLSSFTFRNERTLDLKITVPESLNYCDAFNDLFEKYTSECRFVGAKTTAMGSLYRLSYNVRLKNSAAIKEFMDDIRCRNGNLEVMISESVAPADEL